MNTCCKAVIFDLDGTLLDTIKDLGNSMNYILTKHGFPKRENDHFVRSIGNGLRKFAEWYKEFYIGDIEYESSREV